MTEQSNEFFRIRLDCVAVRLILGEHFGETAE